MAVMIQLLPVGEVPVHGGTGSTKIDELCWYSNLRLTKIHPDSGDWRSSKVTNTQNIS